MTIQCRCAGTAEGLVDEDIYCAIQIGVLVKDIDVVVRLRCPHSATRVSCAWASSSSRSYLCREARAPAAASALVPGLGATGRWAAGSFLAFHDYIALILRAILLQDACPSPVSSAAKHFGKT